MLNFLDPHVPYDAPPPFRKRFRSTTYPDAPIPMKPSDHWQMLQDQVMTNGNHLSAGGRDYFSDRYDGELVHMDEHVGRVFAWLRDQGLYDSTLVIVTADHGEAIGEHMVMGHGLALYEPEVAVPMIVKLPFSSRRGRIAAGVQHVDIMPTVLEVLDLPIPAEVQGRSMLAAGSRDLVVEEHIYPGAAKRWPRFNRMQWAVYRGSLKYLEYSDGERELFDLTSDPDEQKNLAAERETDVKELADALNAWRERTRPLEEARAAPIPVTPEDAQKLRDLGYIQ
jgi:arylsulfatase A-like enzyme